VEAAFVGSWTQTGAHVAGVVRCKGELPLEPRHAVGLEEALSALQGRTGAEKLASVDGIEPEAVLSRSLASAGGDGSGGNGGGHQPGGAAHVDGSEDAAPDQPARPPKHAPGSQGAISAEIAQQRQRYILDALPTPQAKVEFVSCAGRGAGAWVTAAPVDNDRRLGNTAYRISASQRLGLPLPPCVLGELGVDVKASTALRCTACKHPMTLDGTHAYTCLVTANRRTERHHKLVNVLARVVYGDRAATKTGLSCDMRGHIPLEPRCDDHGWPRKPGHQDKRALEGDISERHDDDPANPKILDIVICHPLAAKLPSSATTLEGAGSAAAAAEKRKEKHYNKQYDVPRGRLVPVAFESSGAWGSMGDKHFRGLARRYLRPVEEIGPDESGRMSFIDHGGSYSIFVRHLREVVAVRLQRDNAECVWRWASHCVPKAPKSAAVGDADVAELPLSGMGAKGDAAPGAA